MSDKELIDLCKKEVAEKYGLGNLVTGHKSNYWEECMELYAVKKAFGFNVKHIELLIMSIDGFLEPLHPIRHSSSYLKIKNILNSSLYEQI